tara:strand:+ start:994 stop:1410 length:417 start_codon:yes stop_codon:yes gene_type:complete
MKKIFLTLTILFFLIGCDPNNPGGVLTYNKIPTSVLEFIDRNNILDDEEIIAYYDVTIFLNNSESAILTNKNIIYYNNGRVMKNPLDEILSIDAEEDTFGLNIYITSINNPLMTVVIAPWNGGDLFLDLLTKEVGKFL